MILQYLPRANISQTPTEHLAPYRLWAGDGDFTRWLLRFLLILKLHDSRDKTALRMRKKLFSSVSGSRRRNRPDAICRIKACGCLMTKRDRQDLSVTAVTQGAEGCEHRALALSPHGQDAGGQGPGDGAERLGGHGVQAPVPRCTEQAGRGQRGQAARAARASLALSFLSTTALCVQADTPHKQHVRRGGAAGEERSWKTKQPRDRQTRTTFGRAVMTWMEGMGTKLNI